MFKEVLKSIRIERNLSQKQVSIELNMPCHLLKKN